jgi:phosphoribosylglycinamide formyltransferase-1
LQAILDAIDHGELDAEVALVVSNKEEARGLERARVRGIPTAFVDHREFECREAFDRDVVMRLKHAGCDLVVLAGFMRLVTHVLLTAYPDRVVNVHPALLPAFPGVHAARQALAYGVKYTGCTVHLVDAGVDTGPILAQAVVPVFDGDTEATLVARIQAQEHALFPVVLSWFSCGRVKVEREQEGRTRVRILEEAS